MNYRAIMLAGVAASVLVTGGQAFAEDNTNIIEELVITAEKREQNLQDVPVAISAFTARQRDIVGINSIQDLTIFPPGFVSQVVAFAFGLAASSFFPVLVLGVFHKRVGTVAAMTGSGMG